VSPRGASPAPISVPSNPFSIDAFGAVAGVDTQAAATKNGAALAAAMAAAAAATNPAQRGVLIPADAVYAYLPTTQCYSGLSNLTVVWEGTLALYTANFTSFPGWPNVWPGLCFQSCAKITLVSQTGRGLFNGRGNAWWWYTILVKDNRNNLLHTSSCSDLTLSGLTFLNSPQYHIFLDDSLRATVTDVTVRVDIEDQVDIFRYMGGVSPSGATTTTTTVAETKEVLRLAGMGLLREGEGRLAAPEALADARRAVLSQARATSASDPFAPEGSSTRAPLSSEAWFDPAWLLPAAAAAGNVGNVGNTTPPVPMVWALNTDGIDVLGQHITVTNCSVTNFDDSVCVKPMGAGSHSSFGSTCTGDVYIANVDVTWGVGVSMGSVPPDAGGNCIDGVHATNVTFTYPLKAVYVKPNPYKAVPNATGLIANVLYENMVALEPVWWSVWIGTQQQAQPGTGGGNTGCSFLYPLPGEPCPTDPEVTVTNITLRNLTFLTPLLSAGILIANASNPATNIVFDGVVVTGNSTWPVAGGDYLCESFQGVATGGTSPVPPCFTTI
jgi:hypothetical protein